MLKRVVTMFVSLLVFVSVLVGLYILTHAFLPAESADPMAMMLVVLGALGTPSLFVWLLFEVNR